MQLECRKFALLALALAGGFLVPSCASKKKAPDEAASSTAERSDSVTEAEEAGATDKREVAEVRQRRTGLERLVKSNNRFAFDLHRSIDDPTVAFSPYSISTAVAMLEAGANNDTRTAIRKTLRFDLPEQDLHEQYGRLVDELARRKDVGTEGDDNGFRLKVVNALWTQKGLTPAADFGRILEMKYDASYRNVDFESQPEGAREAINSYVSESTAGKIPELMPKGTVNTLTRLLLTNTVYFNAPWETAFKRDLTKQAEFSNLDGSKSKVPMMFNSERLRYFEGDDFQLVELPYTGGEVAAVIILPDDEKFEAVDARLTGDRFAWMVSQAKTAPVELHLPRFELRSRVPLKSVLSGMGMESVFNPETADFSRMAASAKAEDLYVSDVLHEAFVSVDEAGTEAAAGTGVATRTLSAFADTPVQMRVDRPFIFAIHDRKTGALLFLGRVSKL